MGLAQDYRAAWLAGFDAEMARETAGRWIPVSERLPEDRVRVLGFDGDRVFEAELFEGQWIWVSNKAHNWVVTHWMPLPEPPEVR